MRSDLKWAVMARDRYVAVVGQAYLEHGKRMLKEVHLCESSCVDDALQLEWTQMNPASAMAGCRCRHATTFDMAASYLANKPDMTLYSMMKVDDTASDDETMLNMMDIPDVPTVHSVTPTVFLEQITNRPPDKNYAMIDCRPHS